MNDRSRLWEVPLKLAMDYGLKEGQGVELYCGSLSAQALIITGEGVNIGLSNNILNQLKLPEHLKIGIQAEGGGKFRLGPVIGILTFSHVIAKNDFNRYIPYALRIKDIGLLYVFGPKSINSGSKTIKGYYYNEIQNMWQEREFPFPDVVMDRTYPNSLKTHLKLEKVIGQNRIFNKKTLISKIKFFRTLHKDSLLQEHIPETRRYRKASDLDYMLGKYCGVFLKPANGMKGKGIIQVLKSNNQLACKYMSQNGPETLNIKNSDGISDVIKITGLGKKRYIIQAAIARMKYNNQPFEFRVMTAKNGNGQWSVPAVFTKIANSNSFLTNISAGAKMIFFKDHLNEIKNKLPCSKDQFVKLLFELSVRTASTLDHRFGPLGKLGIDIIIDNLGKPWLIEANGNPGLMPRAALDEYPDWRSQMYDFPLAYCLYLSGFSHLKNSQIS